MVKEAIREIQLKDKNQWEKLYKGYADFYKVEMNDKILQTVWSCHHNKHNYIYHKQKKYSLSHRFISYNFYQFQVQIFYSF